MSHLDRLNIKKVAREDSSLLSLLRGRKPRARDLELVTKIDVTGTL